MQISIRVKWTENKAAKDMMWKKIDRGLDDLADFILERSQQMVPVNESMLKKSGYTDKKYLMKHIGYGKEVDGKEIGYAMAVEFGSRPHYLPVKAINEDLTRWAHLVLGLNQKDANAAAWAISKKIAAVGTEAQPYLRPAVDEAKIKAAAIIKNAMRK